MFEASLSQNTPSPESQEPHHETGVKSLDRPPHLDVTSLMKEKNCYFVHTIQVTNHLDVSQNNRAVDTTTLSTGDRLDILYGASPTLSVSTVRPHHQDGTFLGGFGVIFAQGEVVSANPSDDGTIAKSLTEREIIGGPKNSEEDINRAIDRNHGDTPHKSYNEIVLKNPTVAAGFMKLDASANLSYREETLDYGVGGGEVTKKVGILDLNNEYSPGLGGRKGELKRGYDKVFATLLEMKSRGPVYLMNEQNEMLAISRIDEKTRTVEFSIIPSNPSDIAKRYGEQKLNRYAKEEMLGRLASNGVVLH